MAVEKIQATGFIPTCVIMDQGSNNISALRQMGITKEKPFFTVNESKIYILYDPPHLLKSIRNNLKNHGFLVNGELAAWSDIAELYKQDSKRSIRMVPKLTQDHIMVGPFKAMSVPLAAKVSACCIYIY